MPSKYYKATRLRSYDGNSTGIGIIEYMHGHQTLAIASLYYDYPLTNHEAFEEIKRYVDETRDGQTAKVRLVSVRNFKAEGDVRYVALRGGAHTREPKALALDALRRRSTICEKFEVPIIGGVK